MRLQESSIEKQQIGFVWLNIFMKQYFEDGAKGSSVEEKEAENRSSWSVKDLNL